MGKPSLQSQKRDLQEKLRLAIHCLRLLDGPGHAHGFDTAIYRAGMSISELIGLLSGERLPRGSAPPKKYFVS
jgi:hypothetical protein